MKILPLLFASIIFCIGCHSKKNTVVHVEPPLQSVQPSLPVESESPFFIASSEPSLDEVNKATMQNPANPFGNNYDPRTIYPLGVTYSPSSREARILQVSTEKEFQYKDIGSIRVNPQSIGNVTKLTFRIISEQPLVSSVDTIALPQYSGNLKTVIKSSKIQNGAQVTLEFQEPLETPFSLGISVSMLPVHGFGRLYLYSYELDNAHIIVPINDENTLRIFVEPYEPLSSAPFVELEK